MVSDRRDLVIHPLIYPHPNTGKQTLCFHLGMTQGFIWDKGLSTERETDWPETENLLVEIDSEITRDGGRHNYSHKVYFNLIMKLIRLHLLTSCLLHSVGNW
jgi:hypothetical protein